MPKNMNGSILKSNFMEFAKEPIRVPKIQRDYAQGRKNDAATGIRRKFVHDIIQAIKQGEELQLDFVYGSQRYGAFEPLDGQQRLTTLFLLHWYFGFEMYSSEAEVSRLTYETRGDAKDFCHEFVYHEAKQFIDEVRLSHESRQKAIDEAVERLDAIKEKINGSLNIEKAEIEANQKEFDNAKKQLIKAKAIPYETLSSLILNRDWFNYLWKYDPTVQSMLVMLDAIHEEVENRQLDMAASMENLSKITFSRLDLGDFDLSDELFIKMNARGKQLSTFDILKSSLEEEIQVQKSELRCDDNIEQQWRAHIDGQWIDWFWNLYAVPRLSGITDDEKEYKERLSFARAAEEQLKKLILRILSLQLIQKTGEWDELKQLCYEDDVYNLEKLIMYYNDKFRPLRNSPGYQASDAEIDFNEVLECIDSLYYKDEIGVYKSIFSDVNESFNINPDFKYLNTLDLFQGDKCPNDCKVIFAALLSFARRYPCDRSKAWKSNFEEWAHFCRNVFINDNNNARIDKAARFTDALSGVDSIIAEMTRFSDSITDEYFVRKFIAGLEYETERGKEPKTFKGIDNESLREEIRKAQLKLSDIDWESQINEAESDHYLWGQIRCLLDWANGSIKDFSEYFAKLHELIALPNKNLLYAGILSINPSFGFDNTRLYLFNNDRDNSFKRYMRNRNPENSQPTPHIIKEVIDVWRTEPYKALDGETFLNNKVAEGLEKDWSYVRCILDKKEILDYAGHKRIFNINGYYNFASRKTENSHLYDIALLYLAIKLKEHPECYEVAFFDSVAETEQNAVWFRDMTSRVEYWIRQNPNQGGNRYYILSEGEDSLCFENECQLLKYISAHFQFICSDK